MTKYAIVLGFALAFATAGTAFAAGGGPKATGSGVFEDQSTNNVTSSIEGDHFDYVEFNAKESKEQGQQPDKGHVALVHLFDSTFSLVNGGGFTGTVNCYFQPEVSNPATQGEGQAWFSGTVDPPALPELLSEDDSEVERVVNGPTYFLFAVQDNGEGSKATGPDLISYLLSENDEFGGAECGKEKLAAENELLEGNIQVHKPKNNGNNKSKKKSKKKKSKK